MAEDNDKLLEQLRLQRQELEQAKVDNAKVRQKIFLKIERSLFQSMNNVIFILILAVQTVELRLVTADIQSNLKSH